MSDTNKSKLKPTLVTVIILLLILFVSVLAWYMFEMKKQLDAMHKQQSTIQLQAPGSTENKKDMLVPDKNEELPGMQQVPVQENQQTQSAQHQNKNAIPDNTPPLIYDNSSTMPSNFQAWNPYAEPHRKPSDRDRKLNHRFNRSYNNTAYNNPGIQRHFRISTSIPKINVKENTNQYIAFMNLPHANEHNISVKLNGQRLTIKGEKDYKNQKRNETGNIIFQERQSGRFQRSITLAKPVRQNEMKKHFDNGVLVITIPKVKYGQWR